MHPNTPDALAACRSGDKAKAAQGWLQLQRIFGFDYVQGLRQQATDETVLLYLESQ